MFLLEESVLLHGLLPRLFPNLPFLCIPHEGKQDLERSIPRKLRAWREAGVHFCVIRDNDQGDCHELKRKLNALCQRLLRVRTSCVTWSSLVKRRRAGAAAARWVRT